MHVSIPHAEIIGNATVSEHCPTQEMSCMVNILFITLSPFVYYNPSAPKPLAKRSILLDYCRQNSQYFILLEFLILIFNVDRHSNFYALKLLNTAPITF